MHAVLDLGGLEGARIFNVLRETKETKVPEETMAHASASASASATPTAPADNVEMTFSIFTHNFQYQSPTKM